MSETLIAMLRDKLAAVETASPFHPPVNLTQQEAASIADALECAASPRSTPAPTPEKREYRPDAVLRDAKDLVDHAIDEAAANTAFLDQPTDDGHRPTVEEANAAVGAMQDAKGGFLGLGVVRWMMLGLEAANRLRDKASVPTPAPTPELVALLREKLDADPRSLQDSIAVELTRREAESLLAALTPAPTPTPEVENLVDDLLARQEGLDNAVRIQIRDRSKIMSDSGSHADWCQRQVDEKREWRNAARTSLLAAWSRLQNQRDEAERKLRLAGWYGDKDRQAEFAGIEDRERALANREATP